MPRRKQHRPQRMQWEEGEAKADAPADEAKEDGSVTSDTRSTSPPAETPPAEPRSSPVDSERASAATPKAPFSPMQDEEPIGEPSAPKEEPEEPPRKTSTPARDEAPPILAPMVVVKKEEEDEEDEEDAPLDFSLKKPSGSDVAESGDEDMAAAEGPAANGATTDSPLDLSVSRRRARTVPHEHKPAKLGRLEPVPGGPWLGARMPSASAPVGLGARAIGSEPHHQHQSWNGKVKRERSTSSELSHPTGSAMKMAFSEKTKGDAFRPASNRQNPWQSQWISRSGEQTKDVFTCVWCKESFQSLADMTLHMKQSPRCGMAGMHAAAPPPPSAAAGHTTPPPPKLTATPPGASGATTKDGVPLPRKLVRGQDVWLGKGAEQTRQILKCMWCGQSFKSLADMTTHMRVTQHYTNIISQEQIISWRTPEDKLANQSQVNAVLTCKVCDQAFGSLKELSYHMVKNSHYKEHILRSITEGGGRRRQTRERRKKSLPVRKLLELERMEMTARSGAPSNQTSPSPLGAAESDGKIACEECAEKVDAKDFVQHIKSCSRSQQLLKTALQQQTRPEPCSSNESRKSAEDDTPPPPPPPLESPRPQSAEPDRAASTESEKRPNSTSSSSTSVLNAIERLIEKSFDSKGKRGGPTSAGILQRLGIDEEVYPPWHPAGSPRYGAIKSAGHSPRLTGGLASPCPSEETPANHASPRSGVSSPDKDAEPPVLDPERLSQPRSPAESVSTRASSPGADDLVIADGLPSRRSSERGGPDTDDLSSSSSCDTPLAEMKSASPKAKQSPRAAASSRPRRGQHNGEGDAVSDHPLKELQKLLDKTDAHLSRANAPQAASPGSILAFSWACNDAATSDSLMKCAFCDTHFVSKGAYRHHLSKMHFIKDGSAAPPPPPQPGDSPTWKAKEPPPAAGSHGPGSPAASPASSPAAPADESPHSKFLKYTELAKQLSSKYV
ncbi:protein tiptop-like isoform X2 [Amblyomma americanum]